MSVRVLIVDDQEPFRLAARIKPRQLVRSPQVAARERQRISETELGTLLRARYRKELRRIVCIGIAGRMSERRLRLHYFTREMRAPRPDSFSSMRS